MAQEWISVKDRLPEDAYIVLVYRKGTVFTARYFPTYMQWETKTLMGYFVIGGISHWMPLPEPPKEEE